MSRNTQTVKLTRAPGPAVPPDYKPVKLTWEEAMELSKLPPVRCQGCNKVFRQSTYDAIISDIATFEMEEQAAKEAARNEALRAVQEIEAEQASAVEEAQYLALEKEKNRIIADVRAFILAPPTYRMQVAEKHRLRLCCLDQILNPAVIYPTTMSGIYEIVEDGQQ